MRKERIEIEEKENGMRRERGAEDEEKLRGRGRNEKDKRIVKRI